MVLFADLASIPTYSHDKRSQDEVPGYYINGTFVSIADTILAHA